MVADRVEKEIAKLAKVGTFNSDEMGDTISNAIFFGVDSFPVDETIKSEVIRAIIDYLDIADDMRYG